MNKFTDDINDKEGVLKQNSKDNTSKISKSHDTTLRLHDTTLRSHENIESLLDIETNPRSSINDSTGLAECLTSSAMSLQNLPPPSKPAKKKVYIEIILPAMHDSKKTKMESVPINDEGSGGGNVQLTTQSTLNQKNEKKKEILRKEEKDDDGEGVERSKSFVEWSSERNESMFILPPEPNYVLDRRKRAFNFKLDFMERKRRLSVLMEDPKEGMERPSTEGVIVPDKANLVQPENRAIDVVDPFVEFKSEKKRRFQSYSSCNKEGSVTNSLQLKDNEIKEVLHNKTTKIKTNLAVKRRDIFKDSSTTRKKFNTPGSRNSTEIKDIPLDGSWNPSNTSEWTTLTLEDLKKNDYTVKKLEVGNNDEETQSSFRFEPLRKSKTFAGFERQKLKIRPETIDDSKMYGLYPEVPEFNEETEFLNYLLDTSDLNEEENTPQTESSKEDGIDYTLQIDNLKDRMASKPVSQSSVGTQTDFLKPNRRSRQIKLYNQGSLNQQSKILKQVTLSLQSNTHKQTLSSQQSASQSLQSKIPDHEKSAHSDISDQQRLGQQLDDQDNPRVSSDINRTDYLNSTDYLTSLLEKESDVDYDAAIDKVAECQTHGTQVLQEGSKLESKHGQKYKAKPWLRGSRKKEGGYTQYFAKGIPNVISDYRAIQWRNKDNLKNSRSSKHCTVAIYAVFYFFYFCC